MCYGLGMGTLAELIVHELNKEVKSSSISAVAKSSRLESSDICRYLSGKRSPSKRSLEILFFRYFRAVPLDEKTRDLRPVC